MCYQWLFSIVSIGIQQNACSYSAFNFLPFDKILDLSNLKDFADDKINVTYVTTFVMERMENIEGKGENADYQHFLLYPSMF